MKFTEFFWKEEEPEKKVPAANPLPKKDEEDDDPWDVKRRKRIIELRKISEKKRFEEMVSKPISPLSYTIYVDMDGVLADFKKGILKEPSFKENYRDFQDFLDSKAYDFTAALPESFWFGLDWMSDGRQLWSYVKKYTPFILSAPAKSNACILGKKKWCMRHLMIPMNRVILENDKHKYANSSSILIDDTQKKIDKFRSHGGIGILHKNTADTIKQLQRLGI